MKQNVLLFASLLLMCLSGSLAEAQVACSGSGCTAYKMWIVNQNWSGFLPQWGFNNGRESTNLCAPSSVFMVTRAITDANVLVKRNTPVWTIGTTSDTQGIPYVAQKILGTSVSEGTTQAGLINGVMGLHDDFATPARGEWVKTAAAQAVGPETIKSAMKRGGVATINYGHFYQTCKLNATATQLICTYQRRGGHTMAVRGWRSDGRTTFVSMYDPAGARKYDVTFGTFLARRSTDGLPISHELAHWFKRSNPFFLTQGSNGYYGITELLTSLHAR